MSQSFEYHINCLPVSIRCQEKYAALMALASITPFQYRHTNIKTKTEKALPREIYGTKNTVLHSINVQRFTTTEVQPTHSAQPPTSASWAQRKSKPRRAMLIVWAPKKLHRRTQKQKTYPVSITRSQAQGLQWQINDTIQPCVTK